MTQWKLGNRAEARQLLERSAVIIEKFAPKHAGWNALQREAEEVLGMQR